MRIISGKFKGTVLKTPEGENTRPTADRVKEGIFSSIQFDIDGAAVLDCFAGSGQLSLEALSRGASFAVLCEKDKKALQIIKENIEKINASDRTAVVNLPFEKSLSLIKKYSPFDIVFIDPPYKSLLWEDTVNLLEVDNLLSGNCKIICECPREYNLPDAFSRYNKREYLYGSVKIVILSKE